MGSEKKSNILLTKLNGSLDIALCFVKDVSNAADIRAMLMEGKLSAAILNTKLIVDIHQLQVAAYRAWDSWENSIAATKNVYSEVIYSLMPTKQISKAFSAFGVTKDDNEMIVVTLGENAEIDMRTVLDHMPSCNTLSLEDTLTEALPSKQAAILKLYKVEPKELMVGSLSDAVCSRMVGKEFLM